MPRWFVWSLLAVIVVLGGVARFAELGETPFGVCPDEALNGVDAGGSQNDGD